MQKAARINMLNDVDISEVVHMTTGCGSQFKTCECQVSESS